jgi:transcriptional regulator with GAF, ATPase, and Fis domain
MAAELVVIAGPLLGSRFPLGSEDVTIGRSSTSTICIPSHDIAWHHCCIHEDDGTYHLTDTQSGSGSYVNGLLTRKQALERGDHIGIGETTLLFTTADTTPVSNTTGETLLRACTIVQVAQAIATIAGEEERSMLERQFIALIADLMNITTGAVLMTAFPVELEAAADSYKHPEQNATFTAVLPRIVRLIRSDGTCFDPDSSCLGVPLYVAGELQGAIVVQCSPEGVADLDNQRDALAAIAVLAASGVQSAREVQGLRAKATLFEEALERSSGIVGESPAMKRLLSLVDKVGPQDTTVLLLGESGTGKELIARAIHKKSRRAKHPFIAINCAALTETLLESEVFGHEKGAFTGAVSQKKGKLELAQGGTFFLDEIGELAAPLQAKLLRVLQEREFERVGGSSTVKLNVRVIAATNRDLLAEVRRGAFRDDLYHRLNVVVLKSPPLRERRDDIPLLARFFMNRSSERCHRRVQGLTEEAERLIIGYDWPGNVRELENAIERAVVLGESNVVLPEDLPETVFQEQQGASQLGPIFASVGEAKRESVRRAWAQAHGDYKVAAQLLGLHPNSLLRLIRTLSLRDQLTHD